MPTDDPHYALTPSIGKTGPVVLGQWYERNEGHHIIVARDVAQLLRMAEALFKKEPYARFQKQWIGEIVLPTVELEMAYSRMLYNSDVRSFAEGVQRAARSIVERGGQMPKNLKPCPVYAYAADYFDECDAEEKAEAMEKHEGCRTCFATKLLPVGDSWKQYFEECIASNKIPPFTFLHCTYDKNLHKPVKVGTPADPEKPLYYVNPGSSNQRLQEIKPESPYMGSSAALFFFQGEEVEVEANIKARQDELQRQQQEEYQRGRIDSDERAERQRREWEEEEENFFKE
jgi:hypothetical protein